MKSMGFSSEGKSLAEIIFLTAIVTLFAFSHISFSRDSTEKYWVDPKDMPAYEEDYLQRITPQPVDPGLGPINNSGYVILYGQLLEPPFQLVLRGDSLFLNGVRVEPQLTPPWGVYTEPFEITECDSIQSAVTSQIEKKFKKYTAENKNNIDKELINYIERELPEVKSAKWLGEFGESNTLFLEWTCDSFPLGMALPPVALPSEEEMMINYRKSLKAKKKHISSSLSMGGLVSLGLGGTGYISSHRADSIWVGINNAIRTQSYDILHDFIKDGAQVYGIIYYQQNKRGLDHE
mgnify:CR=1 FL=1